MEPVITPASDAVFHVEGAGTNWQILVEGSHVTLIDAAWPKDYDLVAWSLEKVGRKPADVEVILLTHAHRDHLGTAAEFHRRHHADVRTHVDEAAHARGDVIEEISKWALFRQLWRPTVMLFVANVVRHGATRVERLPNVKTFDGGSTLDVPGRPTPVGRLSNPEWPGHSIAAPEDHAERSGRTTRGRRRAGQKQTRLTPPQVDDLVAERRAGATIAELARRFDIHRTTVMAHLRRRAGGATS